VRKTWLSVVLLALAILVQLTVLNGLHLPGGGVPDLVLILLVALAIAAGPVPGAVTGFVAGLCLDLAPPDSGLLGQYALVFCLAGWAAGQLAGSARRMPLRTLAAGAIVVAAAEAATAGLALLLHPAQVTIAEIRQLLPVTIGYDLLLFPFALYLVMLAVGALGSAALASSRLAGTGHSALTTTPARSRRAERRHRPHQPRLSPAAARAGDGWVGGGPHVQGGRSGSRRPARLHPGAGAAGSASGLVRHRPLPATVVNLRLTAPRRGDGVVGNVGPGLGGHWQPSRHPGLLAGPSGRFRPHAGEISGSAARQQAAARPGLRKAGISFKAHPGDGSLSPRLGASWLSVPVRPSRTGPRMRTGAGRSALTQPVRTGLPARVPRLNFRTASPRVVRRPAATPKFRGSGSSRPVVRRPAATPKFRGSGSSRPVVRRPAAAPKFRRGFRHRSSGLTTGLVAGGVLDHSTFRAYRRSVGLPQLRLAGRSHGAGMLGGSGRSPLRRPPPRPRLQPRFGYGRRSVLSFLTGRRIGGRWLARKRVGSRSGVWLLGRRTGGVR
jgi:rod shape-determining protein MreD